MLIDGIFVVVIMAGVVDFSVKPEVKVAGNTVVREHSVNVLESNKRHRRTCDNSIHVYERDQVVNICHFYPCFLY